MIAYVEEMLRCGKCGEEWPKTEEFFYRDPISGNCTSPCKACIIEKRHQTNAIKPCCVPGCGQPRAALYSSRCYEHRREQEIANYNRWKAVKHNGQAARSRAG